MEAGLQKWKLDLKKVKLEMDSNIWKWIWILDFWVGIMVYTKNWELDKKWKLEMDGKKRMVNVANSVEMSITKERITNKTGLLPYYNIMFLYLRNI